MDIKVDDRMLYVTCRWDLCRVLLEEREKDDALQIINNYPEEEMLDLSVINDKGLLSVWAFSISVSTFISLWQ